MASETENYFTSVERIQALLSLPFYLQFLTPTSDYIIYSNQMSIILVLFSEVFSMFHVMVMPTFTVSQQVFGAPIFHSELVGKFHTYMHAEMLT